MSIPHFTVTEKQCKWCDSVIYIGHVAIYSDGYYCDEDCLKDQLLEETMFKDVYLTDDDFYKGMD